MKIIMKHIRSTVIIITAFVLFINYNLHAQNKPVNFSGQWHLNESKSDFGRLTAASAKNVQILTISQTTNEIDIKSGDSTAATIAMLRLDGKSSQLVSHAVVNEIATISKSELTTQWINDHTVIVTLDHPKGPMPAATKTYTISQDLQTFIIDYKLKYGESKLTGKLIYDKQMGN